MTSGRPGPPKWPGRPEGDDVTDQDDWIRRPDRLAAVVDAEEDGLYAGVGVKT